MPKFGIAAVMLAAGACVFAGCRPEPSRPLQNSAKAKRIKPEMSGKVLEPAASGHPEPAPGAIRGIIRFRGKPPVEPVIDFSSNPQCARAHLKPLRAETVVVNGNRTLRDTFVWIKSGLARARWTPPAASAELDQSGCMYRPHVLALMVNQELEIRNSDPVNHDVHVEAVKNAESNEAEPPRAETLRKRYPIEEIWFPVTCSVHPWMHSYVSVVSHPFFAVTGTDGSFAWNDVPAGQYVIETIQEKLGKREQHVTVAPGRTSTMEFVYAP